MAINHGGNFPNGSFHVTNNSGINTSRPRTIVCKLLSHSEKVSKLNKSNKLKGTDSYNNEGFSYDTIMHRKQL